MGYASKCAGGVEGSRGQAEQRAIGNTTHKGVLPPALEQGEFSWVGLTWERSQGGNQQMEGGGQ